MNSSTKKTLLKLSLLFGVLLLLEIPFARHQNQNLIHPPNVTIAPLRDFDLKQNDSIDVASPNVSALNPVVFLTSGFYPIGTSATATSSFPNQMGFEIPADTEILKLNFTHQYEADLFRRPVKYNGSEATAESIIHADQNYLVNFNSEQYYEANRTSCDFGVVSTDLYDIRWDINNNFGSHYLCLHWQQWTDILTYNKLSREDFTGPGGESGEYKTKYVNPRLTFLYVVHNFGQFAHDYYLKYNSTIIKEGSLEAYTSISYQISLDFRFSGTFEFGGMMINHYLYSPKVQYTAVFPQVIEFEPLGDPQGSETPVTLKMQLVKLNFDDHVDYSFYDGSMTQFLMPYNYRNFPFIKEVAVNLKNHTLVFYMHSPGMKLDAMTILLRQPRSDSDSQKTSQITPSLYCGRDVHIQEFTFREWSDNNPEYSFHEQIYSLNSKVNSNFTYSSFVGPYTTNQHFPTTPVLGLYTTTIIYTIHTLSSTFPIHFHIDSQEISWNLFSTRDFNLIDSTLSIEICVDETTYITPPVVGWHQDSPAHLLMNPLKTPVNCSVSPYPHQYELFIEFQVEINGIRSNTFRIPAIQGLVDIKNEIWFPQEMNVHLSLDMMGEFTLFVKVIDEYQNHHSIERQFFYDIGKPTLIIESDEFMSTAAIPIDIIENIEIARFEYQIDKGEYQTIPLELLDFVFPNYYYINFQLPTQIIGELTPGPHQITFRVSDTCGNWNWQTITIHHNSNLPIVTVEEKDLGLLNQPCVVPISIVDHYYRATYIGLESGASLGLYHAINPVQFNPNLTPFQLNIDLATPLIDFNSLPDGEYTMIIAILNLASVPDDPSTYSTLEIDFAKDTYLGVRILSPLEGSHFSNGFNLHIQALKDKIISKTEFAVENGPFIEIMECYIPTSLLPLAYREYQGTLLFHFRFTDMVGNIATISNIPLIHDSIKPDINIKSPKPMEKFSQSPLFYDLSINEPNLASFGLLYENQEFFLGALTGYIPNSVWNLIGEFNGYLQFFAYDKAGNKGQVGLQVIIDQIAPLITIYAPEHNGSAGIEPPWFWIQIQDANFRAAFYEINGVKYTIGLENMENGVLQGNFDAEAWRNAYAEYVEVRFTAIDDLGNYGQSEIIVIWRSDFDPTRRAPGDYWTNLTGEIYVIYTITGLVAVISVKMIQKRHTLGASKTQDISIPQRDISFFL